MEMEYCAALQVGSESKCFRAQQGFGSDSNEFLPPDREVIICIMISDLANNQRE